MTNPPNKSWRTLALLVGFALSGTLTAAAEVVPARDSGAKTSRLQGVAFLGRNRPVTGVSVLVEPKEDPSARYVTSSDEKGRFRVDGLGNGLYRVAVARDGLTTVVKDNVRLRFPFRAVVEVAMVPFVDESPETEATPTVEATADPDPVRIRGTILDRAGDPISDVMLRLVHVEGQADPRQLRAGAVGDFDVELARGTWTLQADVAGYLPIRASLALGLDTHLAISMVQQPPTYLPTPLELMPPEQPLPPAGVRLGPVSNE